MAIYSWFTYLEWWCSIATLKYQEVVGFSKNSLIPFDLVSIHGSYWLLKIRLFWLKIEHIVFAASFQPNSHG